MTCIAWDGVTLAGDRAAWSGSCCYPVKKVYRIESRSLGRILVGLSGDGGYAHAVLRWLETGENPGEYPERLEKGAIQIGLIVKRNRRVLKLDSALRLMPTYGRIHALGGGQDMAIGALAAGASARLAVRIVMRHSDMAGIGVDVVRF